MEKTQNNKAWFLVLPVLVIVAFSAVIPLMTVVNYSVQDTFGNNQFFWNGLGWFQEVLESDRIHAALGRQLLFSAIILAIEIPLGIFIALNMPKRGFWASFCLVVMSLPLLIPWNVVGTIWQVFGRVDIGLLGHTLAALGIDVLLPALGVVVLPWLWELRQCLRARRQRRQAEHGQRRHPRWRRRRDRQHRHRQWRSEGGRPRTHRQDRDGQWRCAPRPRGHCAWQRQHGQRQHLQRPWQPDRRRR